jgi:hypothetical protein
MGVGAFVTRLDRWAARFSRWIGGTAVAAGAVERSGSSLPAVDPAAVVAVLGEIERESPASDDHDTRTSDD